MAVTVNELEQAQKAYRVRERRAGKQTSARRRKGYTCCTAEYSTTRPTLAQTALPLPSVEMQEVPPTEPSHTPKLDMAAVYNNIMYTPCHGQAFWSDEQKAAYVESVTKNNPYWTAFLEREAEEEMEEFWERREHEAEMRLRQDEARRAAIRQAEIQASQQRISYQSFPVVGRWHEREDDLDWW